MATTSAPVLSCVVMHRGKVLLVERGERTRTPGKWGGITGMLDEPGRTVGDAAYEALREELGIPQDEILSLHEGEAFEQEDEEHERIWVVHPVLVEIATDEVTLGGGGEDENFAWVEPEEARQYELEPDFEKVLDACSL